MLLLCGRRQTGGTSPYRIWLFRRRAHRPAPHPSAQAQFLPPLAPVLVWARVLPMCLVVPGTDCGSSTPRRTSSQRPATRFMCPRLMRSFCAWVPCSAPIRVGPNPVWSGGLDRAVRERCCENSRHCTAPFRSASSGAATPGWGQEGSGGDIEQISPWLKSAPGSN
jgi:hypothetical protein